MYGTIPVTHVLNLHPSPAHRGLQLPVGTVRLRRPGGSAAESCACLGAYSAAEFYNEYFAARLIVGCDGNARPENATRLAPTPA